MQTKLCVEDLFSPLSLALTTGTCELPNWTLLYGITGVFFVQTNCCV